MTRESARSRWIGPLALLLALAAVTPRAALAHPADAPALTTVTTSGGGCVKEGTAYAVAVGEYVEAWGDYTAAVEQEDSQAILDAANEIDRTAAVVASTGLLLIVCLVQLM